MVTTVGVRLTGVDDTNIDEAVTFLQLNLIMLKGDIIRALKIPDFIFYSPNFKNSVLTGYSFTVVTVGFSSDHYINVSGGVISIPISRTATHTIYQKLKADEYYPKNLIIDNDVQQMLDLFVKQNNLKLISPTVGDFSPDFNPDFYV